MLASRPPPELLLLILSHINDFPDRLPLLRVCKSWYHILLPAAYSTITVDCAHRLIELVYAIQRFPRLGYSIRILHLPNYSAGGINDEGKYYDETLLQDVVMRVAKDESELSKWKKSLNIGDEDAWLALLLLGLENVKSLNINYDTSPYVSQMMERIVRDEAEKVTAFQRLESIRVWPVEEYCNTFYAREFASFFLLPSMKVFRADKVHQEQEEKGRITYFNSDLRLTAKFSSVREIYLHRSNCRQGFGEFITASAGLERFEYQHSNEAVFQRAYLNFRPRAFYEPLLRQRETLRVLRLNDMGVAKSLSTSELAMGGTQVRETIESWFGNLMEFTALRELRMPLRNLLDFKSGRPLQALTDVLPRGIEVLCLAKVDREDYDLVRRELGELLAGEFFAPLKKVIVQLYQMELIQGEEEECYDPVNFGVPQFAKEAFKDVREACLKKGVEFELTNDGDHQIVRGTEVVVDTEETDSFVLDE